MEDRISLSSWQYMAELTLVSYSMVERYSWPNAMECYLSCLQPFTVVYADSRLVEFFFSHILPNVTVPLVLYMGNGGTCMCAHVQSLAKLGVVGWTFHAVRPRKLHLNVYRSSFYFL